MKNMFTNQEYKTVPKSFYECYEPDPISTNLRKWSHRLENFGKIILFAIIVFGVISDFASAFVVNDYTMKESFDIWIFLNAVITTLLYAFIEYCLYHTIALFVGSLGSIVQNTRISANIALFNSAKENAKPGNTNSNNTQSKSYEYADTWRCKKCNGLNSEEDMFCVHCGQNR